MSKAIVINVLLFLAVWFGCVIGGGVYGLLWPGVLASVLLVVSLSSASCRRQDVLVAMLALPAGLVLDTLWIRLGVLDYGTVSLAPPWILLVWIGVALTINHSLAFLRDRPLIGALVVGVFGPLSYVAAHQLGAIVVPHMQSLWMIGLSWGLVFGLLFIIARRGLARWSVEEAGAA